MGGRDFRVDGQDKAQYGYDSSAQKEMEQFRVVGVCCRYETGYGEIRRIGTGTTGAASAGFGTERQDEGLF